MRRLIAARKNEKRAKIVAVLLGLAVVGAGSARAAETEYRNIIDMDRFVNSLKDPTSHEYRNLMTLERFVAALKDTSEKRETVITTCRTETPAGCLLAKTDSSLMVS